jgi:uncharacterized coiled-coil DUF342 family protein
MAETVEQLRAKRDDLQKKANDLKEKRDNLHKTSKQLAEERDKINANIRSLRNEINEHKTKRDELNERVRHAKGQRDELNEKSKDMKKKIRSLERKKATASGEDLVKLRKQLHSLETEQMTQAMSPQKEKKLIETISELHTKIKFQEDELSKDPKLKKAFEEEEVFKKKAEKQHETVEELASRAQQEHEEMINLITKLDNLIKRVNQIQENIVNTKINADDVHKNFIAHVDRIHEIERELTSLKESTYQKKKKADKTAAHKEASDIFEKFKKGEKLSTEDLMTLQKAGLI